LSAKRGGENIRRVKNLKSTVEKRQEVERRKISGKELLTFRETIRIFSKAFPFYTISKRELSELSNKLKRGVIILK
jgi:hypothetical protein